MESNFCLVAINSSIDLRCGTTLTIITMLQVENIRVHVTGHIVLCKFEINKKKYNSRPKTNHQRIRHTIISDSPFTTQKYEKGTSWHIEIIVPIISLKDNNNNRLMSNFIVSSTKYCIYLFISSQVLWVKVVDTLFNR